MKTYTEPVLTPKGSVADLTRNSGHLGTGDPEDAMIYRYVEAGAVGFLL